jgi:flagellar biosynthesis protein
MSEPIPLPPRRRDANGHAVPPPTPLAEMPPVSHGAANVSAADPGEARRAVALSYDPDHDGVPVVTAVGQGAVAEEIIRRAREAGVAVTEDRQLAAVLSQIDVGEMIPPELYVVITEVLAYVYRLEERVGRRR